MINTFDEYQKLAVRTAKTFASNNSLVTPLDDGLRLDLAHAALGLTSEAGEIATAIKAAIVYNKPLDVAIVKEELGDILWFVNFTAWVLGYDLQQIAKMNIEKLQRRYPEGYTDTAALVRLDKPDEPLSEDALNALMMP